MQRDFWARSIKYACIGVAVLSTTMITSGQQPEENPFQAAGDRGELVKILPPPAAVQAQRDILSALRRRISVRRSLRPATA